jgi:hypothetical protein
VSNRIPLVCWPLIATLVVQSHVLFSVFMFDDFLHLYTVSNLPFLEAISVPWGGHLLHSFTTVVWMVKSLFGPDPFAFLLLGLLVHLASVGLLFEIVLCLTGRAAVAAFGATLWGINPFIAGTLGWVSVHGQAYATVAVLWVLLDIVRCSQRPMLMGNALLVRHAVLLLVAATSFGVGLTSTVILPLLVGLWNPLPAERFRLVVVYGGVAMMAVALYLVTMKLQGDAQDNLGDKVDIVRRAAGNIVPLSRAFFELLAIGFSGLLWGPLIAGNISVVPRESLPFVASLAAVFFTLPLLIWGCWVSEPCERRRIFALLLLPCAGYGLIAIGRPSGYFPLTDAPRYQYLAPAIMAIVYCLVLVKLLDHLPARVVSFGRIPYFLWLAVVIVPCAMGPVPAINESATQWLTPQGQKNQFMQSSRVLEEALENASGRGDVFIRNRPFIVSVLGYTPKEFPGLAGLFVILYPSNSIDGRRVFFLEDSKELVQMTHAQSGARISDLLMYKPKEKE